MAASRCPCVPDAQQHVTHLLDCKCNQRYYILRHNTASDLLAALIRRIRPDVIIHRELLLRAPDEEVADGVVEGEGENEVEGEGETELEGRTGRSKKWE